MADLTHARAIAQWMSEESITILTDWQPGSPVIIRGELHRIFFESKGKVLIFEPEKTLAYSHLSSLSGLDNREPGHYTQLTFIPESQSACITLSY